MTAQLPDFLFYDDQPYGLAANPLEDYFDDDHPRPEFRAPHTALCRGYTAYWLVEDDVLYLIGLEGLVGGDNDLYAVNAEPFGLLDLIPWAGNRVKADWVTGVLRCPQGNRIHYVHRGYESTFERDLFLTVENGNVTGSRIVENCAPDGDSECRGE